MQAKRGPIVAAGLLVVAVVLFIVLHKSGDSSNVTTGVQKFVVQGNQIEGGERDLTYNKGDEVKLQATAPFDFELHIHGYEIEKEGKPGQTVSVSFPASLDGEFEVEVHHLVNGQEASAVNVANLKVNP
jgi:hypothetical protein